MFKRTLLLIAIATLPLAAKAQTSAFNGFCVKGGTPATTQGLSSSNQLEGIIPSCIVTVYLTGTITKATLFKDAIGTPLTNSFTADALGSAAPGKWLFFAATGQGYDVVMSGGIPPLTYSAPVTLTDLIVPSGGGGGTGCVPATTAGVVLIDNGSGGCLGANATTVGIRGWDVSSGGILFQEYGTGGTTVTDSSAHGIYIHEIYPSGTSGCCGGLGAGGILLNSFTGPITLFSGAAPTYITGPQLIIGQPGLTPAGNTALVFAQGTTGATIPIVPVGSIQIRAPFVELNPVTAYSLILPSTQGTGALTNDGAGNLSWGGSGGNITGLTAGFIPLAGSATTLTGNSPLDYNITNTGEVTSSKPFAVAGTGGVAGGVSLLAGTTLTNIANNVTLTVPASVTNYRLQFPGVQPSGSNTYLSCTAADPAVCSWVAAGSGVSGNYVNIGSLVTWTGCTYASGACTVGAPGTNITVSAIPGTYLHLRLVVQAATSAAANFDDVLMQLNGDTTSGHYTWQFVSGTGNTASALANNGTSLDAGGFAGATATGLAGTADITFPYYAGTTFDKTYIDTNGRTNNTGGTAYSTFLWSGTWLSSAAITSIKFFPSTGPNLVAGTTISIYGVN